MKKIVKNTVVFAVIFTLIFCLLPATSVHAAKKKSKTSITVSTQEELVKALKSGKYKKITIKTDAKVSFTVAAKYSSSDLKIVVDAKNATFNSKGTVGSIVVNEAKTVKEYASGNNITVNDENITVKVMAGSSIEKLKVASETGTINVVNNGEISRVDVTGESKINLEQNSSVGRLYIGSIAEVYVTGTTEEKLAVTVKPEAAGTLIKTELTVKVNAYADVELQLEKGAENSAITLKNDETNVKIENESDKKVVVTNADGEKVNVKNGESYSSYKEETPSEENEDSDKTDDKKPEEEQNNKTDETTGDNYTYWDPNANQPASTDPQPHTTDVDPNDGINATDSDPNGETNPDQPNTGDVIGEDVTEPPAQPGEPIIGDIIG
ncbi:MAG: hypothetical protein K5858_02155 [Lachnospiraceae bacterium]|nr:hypothetical protein [Lachnospiraceae bacterium]